MTTGTFFKEELREQKPNDDGVLFPAILSPNTNEEANLCAFEKLSERKSHGSNLIYSEEALFFSEASMLPLLRSSIALLKLLATLKSSMLVAEQLEPKWLAGFTPPMKVPRDENSIPSRDLPDFPSKLFFFCEEPGSGGETPIVLSRIVYEQMKEKQPEFVAKVEEHGLKYIIVTGDDDQSSSIRGRGWKSAYMTNDKKVANERFNLIHFTNDKKVGHLQNVLACTFQKEKKRQEHVTG